MASEALDHGSVDLRVVLGARVPAHSARTNSCGPTRFAVSAFRMTWIECLCDVLLGVIDVVAKKDASEIDISL